MNKINLMGRLTRDPEIETTVNNNLHAKFTIAVDRRFAKEGYQQADFIPISVWGKTAEFASMYFKKGMRVAIVGRLEVNNYTDQSTGQNRTFTQVTAEELYFADGKKEDSEDVKFSNISKDEAFNIDDLAFN